MHALIAARITALIQDAPALDPATVEELAALLLTVALDEALPRPTVARLACALEAALDALAAGTLDPGVALPPMAMAIATLEDGAAGRLGAAALEAARFEIESLLPLPGAAPRRAADAPDVPLTALVRRPPQAEDAAERDHDPDDTHDEHGDRRVPRRPRTPGGAGRRRAARLARVVEAHAADDAAHRAVEALRATYPAWPADPA